MAGPFRQGLARVAKDGRWGHINRDGEFVVAPQFDMAYEFSEGLAVVQRDKRHGYVNRSGALVVDTKFLSADAFSEGLASVNVGTGGAHKSIAEACEVGFIDPAGEFVLSPRYFSAGRFHKGFCLVETEKTLMYVDSTGTPIWTSGWVELGSFDPHHLLPPEII